ncbi:hypothetical protein B0T26DRAFT_484610 [Lasiosphaeria miniovina]|uniref:Uncharacterized protein n=1 Tax=Lasiosphaeria miniovina TaxID=1954250 RepID=A0AA40A0R7_9PEZI|nr:uncharacterized protein B0T26DRAFT_484610 [Lasiosphaeria miniovina]KAK0707114.1 hypothetical protein B0T26DRAFT_484610 [Lasiosphaeria miniovina]
MVVPGSGSGSGSSRTSFPRTFGDVVGATLILRSRLGLAATAVAPGAGDDTLAKLAQRILDAARYYCVQARAAVDIRSWRPRQQQQDDRDTPRVSLTLALDSRAVVRRIDVFIASERLRPRNYHASSNGRVGSDDAVDKRSEDADYHYRRSKSNVVLSKTSAAWRPSSVRSGLGPRRVDSGVSVGDGPETTTAPSVASYNTWGTARGDSSRAASLRSVELDRQAETALDDIVNGDGDGEESPWYHDSQAFLRVEVASASSPSAPGEDGKGSPTPTPPPVPRISNLGVLVDRQRNVDIWWRTWPAPSRLPPEENTTDTRPRPAHASGLDDEQTREWLASLKHGDTVTLAAAEGFFVHDIARFAKFGLVVYCGLSP